ncbi:hypothetical protein ACIO1C_29600 [Streptomyces sp. NPDC087420]|uniref:hypothetical protein n=1 Tax=Streptomyces sp. NPDC087420 TaxID=3365785 RepID=UPI003837C6EE
MDSEWYCVEGPSGTPLPMESHNLGDDGRTTNYETALQRATELAPRYDDPLTVVRFQRSELTKVSRDISVKLEDVSSKRAKA